VVVRQLWASVFARLLAALPVLPMTPTEIALAVRCVFLFGDVWPTALPLQLRPIGTPRVGV